MASGAPRRQRPGSPPGARARRSSAAGPLTVRLELGDLLPDLASVFASAWLSSCSWYSVNAFAYSVASCVARLRVRVLDREREYVAAERGRDRRGLRGTPPGRDRRSEPRRAPVHHGRDPGELSLCLRNALWIDVRDVPRRWGWRSTSADARYVGVCLSETATAVAGTRRTIRRKRKLPSAQDPQVVQEARDDRPVRGADVSVHGRHWAASSRASRPGTTREDRIAPCHRM